MLRNLLIKLLEWLLEKLQPTLPPPPPPMVLSHFVAEQRRKHPSKTDNELGEKVWLKCISDTKMYAGLKDKDGEYKRNDDAGNILFAPVDGNENNIKEGQEVYVYRWAFDADGGSVRAVVYQSEYVINIKHFTKP